MTISNFVFTLALKNYIFLHSFFLHQGRCTTEMCGIYPKGYFLYTKRSLTDGRLCPYVTVVNGARRVGDILCYSDSLSDDSALTRASIRFGELYVAS